MSSGLIFISAHLTRVYLQWWHGRGSDTHSTVVLLCERKSEHRAQAVQLVLHGKLHLTAIHLPTISSRKRDGGPWTKSRKLKLFFGFPCKNPQVDELVSAFNFQVPTWRLWYLNNNVLLRFHCRLQKPRAMQGPLSNCQCGRASGNQLIV